jgi:hypothetical protein
MLGHSLAGSPEPQTLINGLQEPAWGDAAKNQWDQVDDFKWLKADHSPNWSIMPAADQIQGDFWVDKVGGKADDGVPSLLHVAGIRGA